VVIGTGPELKEIGKLRTECAGAGALDHVVEKYIAQAAFVYAA